MTTSMTLVSASILKAHATCRSPLSIQSSTGKRVRRAVAEPGLDEYHPGEHGRDEQRARRHRLRRDVAERAVAEAGDERRGERQEHEELDHAPQPFIWLMSSTVIVPRLRK